MLECSHIIIFFFFRHLVYGYTVINLKKLNLTASMFYQTLMNVGKQL